MKKKKSKIEKIKKQGLTGYVGGLKTRVRTNLFHQGSFDVVFACIVLLLFTVGIIAMYSASYAYATYNRGDANAFFTSQLGNAVIGFIAMAIFSKVDYRVFNGRFAPFAYIMTVAVLVYTLIYNMGGSSETSRWIYIGGMQIQPSEFAKFTLIIVMAYMICVMKNALRAPKNKFGKFTPDKDTLSDYERKIFA
ncbi:MAG: FtsW/RodA/SpoVE family cell cycle protein, partial [Clostridia bacterium]|nr:FtsW/RodA/SpoVE family cell cycle protein [Clostridia bacterium]